MLHNKPGNEGQLCALDTVGTQRGAPIFSKRRLHPCTKGDAVFMALQCKQTHCGERGSALSELLHTWHCLNLLSVALVKQDGASVHQALLDPTIVQVHGGEITGQ